MRLVAGDRHLHAHHHMVSARAQPHQLPGACEIERQLGNVNVLDEQAEQSFVELVGKIEFFRAPAGGEPIPRDKKQDCFATGSRLVEGALPSLSGRYAAIRIDIEKNIVPAFTLEPIAQCDRLDIICARMAQKETRHATVPGGGVSPWL